MNDIYVDDVRRDDLSYSEGVRVVSLNGKYGYADENGKIVIPPRFKDACSFSEGLAVVYVVMGKEEISEGDWSTSNEIIKSGFINHKGEYAIIPQFDRAFGFHNGIAAIEIDSKWGFIDKTGTRFILPQFEDVEPRWQFSNGLALVKSKGKWGYIDKRGYFCIPAKFDEAEPFSPTFSQHVLVKLNGELFFIDREGKRVNIKDNSGHSTYIPSTIPPVNLLKPK